LPSRRTDASTPPASIEIVKAPGATAAILTASICAPASARSAAETSAVLSLRARPRGSRRSVESAACSPPGP
jgi:hypothetical protein